MLSCELSKCPVGFLYLVGKFSKIDTLNFYISLFIGRYIEFIICGTRQIFRGKYFGVGMSGFKKVLYALTKVVRNTRVFLHNKNNSFNFYPR